MNPESNRGEGAVSPVIVEDLFLTESFLIKGRLSHKYHRLTKMLEDTARLFLQIEDATMVPLRGGRVIQTPSIHVNREEIIFAHELVDTAGDETQRHLASAEKPVKIRAFYNGAVQLELAGMIAPGAYEPNHNAGRWYFILQQPDIRGLDLDAHEDLGVLRTMDYCIVRKSKLAYIYDFS